MKQNSLNTFRLLACLEVMLGHFQAHLNLQLPTVVNAIVDTFHGVPIFFVLSGFLIYKSLIRSNEWNVYFKKRILRLYPELWVCVIVSLVSIIIFYNESVPWVDYVLFGFSQGTVFQFWTPDSLRGFGCGTPNGSLWTITVIVQFYLLIFILFNWLKKANIKIWVVLLVLSIFWPLFVQPLVYKHTPTIVAKVIGCTVLNHGWMFFIGVFIARFENILLPYLKKYWLLILAIHTILRITHIDIMGGSYPIFGTFLLGLFMIGAAYGLPQLNVKKDISYSIYIYHMVFANIAIQLGYVKSWTAFILCGLVTFLVAYISTETIGKLSNKIKEKK